METNHDRDAQNEAVCIGDTCGGDAAGAASADEWGTNYDESKVPRYTLPDPLATAAGRPVTTAAQWREQRRPEILRLFEKYEYGKMPGRPESMTAEVRSRDPDALGGKALRKEVRIHLRNRGREAKMDMLLYLPLGAKEPVPLFLALNFLGNQTIGLDPGVALCEASLPEDLGRPGVVNHRATEKSRGVEPWPVEKILARGYGLATICYNDITPDAPESFTRGVHALFFAPGQTRPAADQWGAIAAWAWGLRRAMDYLETDKGVDTKRVVVLGHSRLGKTALWAAACDERFAIAISNESGTGGATLARRHFGETVRRINSVFPHWFCDNFKHFNDREEQLPFDQHTLLALIAPRPVYIAAAAEDLWGDPRGAFQTAKAADPVYRLLGTDGLAADKIPGIEQPILSTIGYHIRRGKHALTEYDWMQYSRFRRSASAAEITTRLIGRECVAVPHYRHPPAIAAKAKAAVSTRRIRGPRSINFQPAAVASETSSSVNPPSGPTANATPADGVGWAERSESHHELAGFAWWGSLRSAHPTRSPSTATEEAAGWAIRRKAAASDCGDELGPDPAAGQSPSGGCGRIVSTPRSPPAAAGQGPARPAGPPPGRSPGAPGEPTPSSTAFSTSHFCRSPLGRATPKHERPAATRDRLPPAERTANSTSARPIRSTRAANSRPLPSKRVVRSPGFSRITWIR